MADETEVNLISAFFADPKKATEALARGVREALLEHKRAGDPIAICGMGKSYGSPRKRFLSQRAISRTKRQRPQNPKAPGKKR